MNSLSDDRQITFHGPRQEVTSRRKPENAGNGEESGHVHCETEASPLGLVGYSLHIKEGSYAVSITEWNPWGEFLSMRDAMDELMRGGFTRPRAAAMGLQIPVDVYETNNDFIIYATMPGVNPSDVHIQTQGNTVRITGDMKEELPQGMQGQQTQQQMQQTQQGQQQDMQGRQQGQQGHWLLRERRAGHFVRVITLPTNVESNEAKAEFQNGMLVITLPKAAEARAKAIPIRTSGQQSTQQIEAQGRTH